MGKGNFLLKSASGKLGDMVFYHDGGEQRFRTRIKPANPQSNNQQSQRSRLGGVTNTFRAAKGILADSFETKAVNQSAFNAFAASALPTAPYLSKTAVAAGGAVPMPMAISKGSIPNPFEYTFTDTGVLNAAINAVVTGTESALTWGDVSAALIAAKPCAFRNGVAIVGVEIRYEGDGETSAETTRPTLHADKLVIDTESTVLISAMGNLFSVEYSTGVIEFVIDGSGDLAAFAIFVADNTQGDGLRVSSSNAFLSATANALYAASITEAARIAAAESYGGSNQHCIL